ncbi:BRO-N domain-containing protein [Stappia indica]|uniref:BRO-N domain-containing protein n=1 Tax=Stappia indica TaxID=538381 RepID=UPI001D18C620|nr:Bro-N domain-containing protein [Stappia indica]MCC4243384.1 Bro-N domain-containing protein [Stappia indica]
MNDLQNFVFEEHLVRVVTRDGEPWFVGKDVCAVLSIAKHHQALDSLDEDERGTCNVGTPGGYQEMIVVSQPGVFRLIFRSRKPEAERFKRWVFHEVLPQIHRTGRYAPAEPSAPALREALTLAIDRDAPMGSKAEILRVCRALFGKDAARSLWRHLGLPDVAPDEWTGTGEAVGVMSRILDHRPDGADGRDIRTLIVDALDGDEEARLHLVAFGIRPSDETDGFWLANTGRGVRSVFSETAWADGSWRIVLRRLAGAQSGPRTSFSGHQSRTTWFPARVLDDWCGTRN